MNLANVLTLSRLPLLLLVVGALLAIPTSGAATIALILFVIAALTDWLDGVAARKLKQISDFGKLMDALLDKVLVVGLLTALLAVEIIPSWTLFPVILILTREFMVTGLRLLAAAKQVVLAAEKSGKLKTILQMVSLTSLLVSVSLQSDFQAMPAVFGNFFYWVGLVSLLLATLQTVYSGLLYFWKYRNLMN